MSRITFKMLKKACKIAQEYNVVANFAYDLYSSESDVDSREIFIDLDQANTINNFWSIFFHELAHIWCYDNDKYTVYHQEPYSKKEMGRYIRRYGLRAEKYVDKIGFRLSKEHNIKFKYIYLYDDPEIVVSYRKWIDKHYPK